MTNRRWDTDNTGKGAGSASQQVGAVNALIEAMKLPDWVAEEPEVHLLPHIQTACARDGSPWRMVSSREEGVVFVVELEWQRSVGTLRQLTVDVFSLVGLIAESNTHVREHSGDKHVDFELTTGMLDEDGQYKGHGHLVLLRVTGEPVVQALRRRSP